MNKQEYKKLSLDFPANEYVYLKMACAKKGVSIKDFVTQSVIKSIEEYEDELDLKALEASKKSIEEEGFITWEEAKNKLNLD